MVTNIETCNFHCGKRPPEGGAYSITNKGKMFFIKPVNVLIHCKFYKGKDFESVRFHIRCIQRIEKTIGTTGNSHGWNWLATAKAYSPLMPAPPPDSSHFCSFFLFVVLSRLRIAGYCILYFCVNHNYNKIVKFDWLSTALISALIEQFDRTVRIMPN